MTLLLNDLTFFEYNVLKWIKMYQKMYQKQAKIFMKKEAQKSIEA